MEHTRIDRLYQLFPRLSQENQRYMLGVTEGLNHAQRSLEKPERKPGLPPEAEDLWFRKRREGACGS